MKGTILVADDNQKVLDSVVPVLETRGYNVIAVADPEQALMYTKPYDLLLTDQCFRDNDGEKIDILGTDIIEAVKARKVGIKTVLMTSGLNANLEKRCRGMGAGILKKYKDGKTLVYEKELIRVVEKYLEDK